MVGGTWARADQWQLECGTTADPCPDVWVWGQGALPLNANALHEAWLRQSGNAQDRRPITPPPCIRLIVLDAATRKEIDIKSVSFRSETELRSRYQTSNWLTR